MVAGWNRGQHKVDRERRECYWCGTHKTYIDKEGKRHWTINRNFLTGEVIGYLCLDCWGRASRFGKHKQRQTKTKLQWNARNPDKVREYKQRRRSKARIEGREYYERTKKDFLKKQYIARESPEFKERHAAYQREYVQKLKVALRNLLNQHVCQRCGYSDVRALQFDHVNGGGIQSRKKLGINHRSKDLYMYYLKRPEEAKKTLQVLCSNCNWIKVFERNEKGGYALSPILRSFNP